MTTQNQKGFTLVEIAIVLVIIGLLLGGVLKGQELIESAKIKMTANQVKEFQSAIYTFQDKYRALPGDFDNADGQLDGVTGGTQNGEISNPDSKLVFPHLIAAGLISGDPDADGLLSNEFGGTISINDNAPFTGTLSVSYTNLNQEQAEFLDQTIDGSIGADVGDVRKTETGAGWVTFSDVYIRLQ